MSDTPPIVLVFAASDPSGGAGVQSDILTLASMGCHPLSVVTAITVQDTMGIEGMMAIEPDWVADQARCVLEDMPVAAFKLGVLGSVENVEAIAEIVSDYPDVPMVFDPALASGRGDEFSADELIGAMRDMLFPQTTILTPNRVEARRIGARDGDEADELADAIYAERILELGCEYVLITGTHANTPKIVNTLYARNGVLRSDEWERLAGAYVGSGSTLAAALAATLANGLGIEDAVRDAQEYTWQSLRQAFRPGMGRHLPDRMFWAREENPSDE